MKRLWMTLALMIGAGLLVGQGVQDSLLRTGRLAYQSGDYSKAIACYRQYLKLAEQAQDEHATADALRLIGDTFRASGELEEALDELDAGLAIATQTADSAMIGRLQNRMAAVKFEMGDLKGTETSAKIALQLSTLSHDQATVANTLNILGAAYRQAGNVPQALAALSQSISILRTLGDTTDIPNALNNMAFTLLDQRDYQAAIDTAMHSFEMAASMGILVYEQLASYILYKSFEGKGELDKSLRWMEKNMDLSSKLNDQARTKEVASLRAEMEAARQEEENAHLKTENILQQQTIANQNDKVIAVCIAAALVLVFTIVLAIVARRQLKQVAQLREQNLKIERQSAEITTYNDQLQAVAQEREIQQLRLQELNHVKDKLFSIISHDLRSPLNSIQGILNLLDGDLISASQFSEMASTLKTRVDGTTLLLDNLLNWSRTQMEGFVAAPTTVDLGELADFECLLQASAAKAKHIQLMNCIPTAMQAVGDKTMIELVIRNLLSNAIKFTEEGGSIQIIYDASDARCHVGIQDNGVGVPEPQVSKVLGQDYFSTIGTAKEKGSGLGLRLCREFIAQNQGELWLAPNTGKGTTFWFSLPIV